MYKKIDEYFEQMNKTLKSIHKKSITDVIEAIIETYNNNGIIFTFGNGGSGATASHFAGDLVKGASMGLTKKFKAICLNDNSPALLAFANDSSYDHVFAGQLESFLTPNDLVIAFSGSGNSPNIINALRYAHMVPAKTIAFCGFDGGKAQAIASISVHAPINDMEIAEDIHLALTHCIKQIIIKTVSPQKNLSETKKTSIVPPLNY